MSDRKMRVLRHINRLAVAGVLGSLGLSVGGCKKGVNDKVTWQPRSIQTVNSAWDYQMNHLLTVKSLPQDQGGLPPAPPEVGANGPRAHEAPNPKTGSNPALPDVSGGVSSLPSLPAPAATVRPTPETAHIIAPPAADSQQAATSMQQVSPSGAPAPGFSPHRRLRATPLPETGEGANLATAAEEPGPSGPLPTTGLGIQMTEPGALANRSNVVGSGDTGPVFNNNELSHGVWSYESGPGAGTAGPAAAREKRMTGAAGERQAAGNPRAGRLLVDADLTGTGENTATGTIQFNENPENAAEAPGGEILVTAVIHGAMPGEHDLRLGPAGGCGAEVETGQMAAKAPDESLVDLGMIKADPRGEGSFQRRLPAPAGGDIAAQLSGRTILLTTPIDGATKAETGLAETVIACGVLRTVAEQAP